MNISLHSKMDNINVLNKVNILHNTCTVAIKLWGMEMMPV